ncbi:hypothetical protein C8F01DRAFT_982387 [Mycena amicta]|nr:hypothetical protein C8F01DRAFT_982387 [Mycena amicta]
MDSQLTLVNPAPALSLAFDTNSMINATLFSGVQPLYTISTELLGSMTELRAGTTGEIVARISRNSILSNTITFSSADGTSLRQMKISKWLQKCKQPDGLHAYAIDTEMGQCLLRKHREYRLALYTEFDLESPVAHWAPLDSASPPTLVISGTIPEAFHPQVICAFIIQELKMRMAEKADLVALGRAAAQSTPLARVR